MQILITIISEQTAPNYLFLKEFEEKFDFFVFISTTKMEQQNKSYAIIKTAGIPKNNHKIITIEENELFSTKEKIRKTTSFSHNDDLWVNITGGTKLMSNAVFDFCKQYNSRFFYVPIGQNCYLELFDHKPAIVQKFSYKLSVDEYLKIYGINYNLQDRLFTNNQVWKPAQKLFLLPKNAQEFIKSIHFIIKNNPVQNAHTKWFEEYCYSLVKETLNLEEKEIITGVELFKMEDDEKFPHLQHDNEIDLAFLYKNNFYLVEAKFSLGKSKISTPNLSNYIYKLAAVNKRFGLRARATLFTLADLTKLTPRQFTNLEKRCQLTGTFFPLHLSLMKDKNIFKRALKNFIK